MLGLAFDPDYAANGRFYVNLTNAVGDTEIRRYERSMSDPDAAAAGYEVLLTFEQPFTNHNGGWIGFNPTATGDARHNLYIATGDGGSGNDPQNNAQNKSSLLGKILRINVAGETGYTSPDTNPFFGAAVDGADEVFAHGLRNPFRAGFDRDTGDLYIGDVGQGAREEIDLIDNITFTEPVTGRAPIRNFGWRLREGNIETPDDDAGGPEPADYVAPIYDYQRGTDEFEGRTVTGGYVYRGPVAALQGLYVFADFNSDHVWAFDPADPQNTIVNLDAQLTPDVGSLTGITSFGEDAIGNLYIVTIGGDVFQIVPEPTTAGLLALASLALLRSRRPLAA